MRPFLFIGLGLLVLSAIAWAIRPADIGGRSPLVWVSDDAPTRRVTIDAFEKGHPAIDLRLDPDNGGMEKVIVQSLAGVGPDVFDCYGPGQLAAYVKSGIALDVTDDLRAMGIDVEKETWPLVRGHFMLNGRAYGLPANASVDALWFDKAAFDAAGLAYPTDIKSWPELIELAAKLTVRDENGRVTRFGLSFDEPLWKPILRGLGGRVFTADGTWCTLDSPQSMAAVTLLRDLIVKHHVMASPGEQEAGAQEGGWGSYGIRSLQSGRAAMSIGGRWWLLTLRKDPSLRLGVATLPVSPGGDRMGGGKATLVSAKSPRRREALAFMRFMAGADYNRVINQEADAVGGVVKYADPALLENPKFPGEDFHGVFRRIMDDATAEERSPFVDSAGADRIINKQLDLVRRDAKSPQDAMRDAAGQVNAEIDRALRRDPALKRQYDTLRKTTPAGAAS